MRKDIREDEEQIAYLASWLEAKEAKHAKKMQKKEARRRKKEARRESRNA